MTNTEIAFLAEIARSNGTDTLVYVWARNTVNEAVAKRQRAERKGTN